MFPVGACYTRGIFVFAHGFAMVPATSELPGQMARWTARAKPRSVGLHSVPRCPARPRCARPPLHGPSSRWPKTAAQSDRAAGATSAERQRVEANSGFKGRSAQSLWSEWPKLPKPERCSEGSCLVLWRALLYSILRWSSLWRCGSGSWRLRWKILWGLARRSSTLYEKMERLVGGAESFEPLPNRQAMYFQTWTCFVTFVPINLN